MALESFGREQAVTIDYAVKACHDLILNNFNFPDVDVEKINFHIGEEGVWSVHPSMLDGRPAVEIRLAVG